MKLVVVMRFLLSASLTFSTYAKGSVEEIEENSTFEKLEVTSAKEHLKKVSFSYEDDIDYLLDSYSSSGSKKENKQQFALSNYLIPAIGFSSLFFGLAHFMDNDAAALTTMAGAIVYGYKKIFNYIDELSGSNDCPEEEKWILWGSELSPFLLKVKSVFDYKKIPYRIMPRDGSFIDGFPWSIYIELVKMGLVSLTHPKEKKSDTFPLAPYVIGPNCEVLYDSSSIISWFDKNINEGGFASVAVSSVEEPSADFLIKLIDGAMSEFGLYMTHHNRWVISADDNRAGKIFANDLKPLTFGHSTYLEKYFNVRQLKRLPYLFSVSKGGSSPATHELLEQSFDELLNALENIFASRDYILGHRFTLADATVFGQLGTNLLDLSARKLIEKKAPQTFAWLLRIENKQFIRSNSIEDIIIDDSLEPLMAWISRYFVPLMKDNYASWVSCKNKGQERFNESAFDAGEAFFEGELAGKEYSSVTKNFHAQVWLEIIECWNDLSPDMRDGLKGKFPEVQDLVLYPEEK